MGLVQIHLDFEATLEGGGKISGAGLVLEAQVPSDKEELARAVVSHLQLRAFTDVAIRNIRRVALADGSTDSAASAVQTMFDLSHVIESGLITYKGLPAPIMCDHLSRERSRTIYSPGTEFQIGKIEMVGNTGTYIDTPFHRYPNGHDLSELELSRVVDVPGVIVRVPRKGPREIGPEYFDGLDLHGRAVLVHTGWDSHWRSDAYFEGHPYLTEEAALRLRDRGASIVGIDSFNIDCTDGGERPVHTVLLGAGIPIVEHLTNLQSLPDEGFLFTALPPKLKGMGTFPVRALAKCC